MRAASGLGLEIPAGQASQQDKRPSRTGSVIYSTCRPHPTALLSKHKGKKKQKQKQKKKKKPTETCPLHSFTQHTDLLSPACQWAVRPIGKGGWIVWNRNNQSRTDCLIPSLLPLLRQLKFVHWHQMDRPHLLGLFRAMRKEDTFHPKTFCTAWGNLYWAAYRYSKNRVNLIATHLTCR